MDLACNSNAAFDTDADLNPNDVILGRGAHIACYEGNIRLRKLVQLAKREYTEAETRHVKHMIAHEIYYRVRQNGGRFLKKLDSKDGETEQEISKQHLAPVSEEVALDKVKQALRDHKKSSKKENNTSCEERGILESFYSRGSKSEDQVSQEAISRSNPRSQSRSASQDLNSPHQEAGTVAKGLQSLPQSRPHQQADIFTTGLQSLPHSLLSPEHLHAGLNIPILESGAVLGLDDPFLNNRNSPSHTQAVEDSISPQDNTNSQQVSQGIGDSTTNMNSRQGAIALAAFPIQLKLLLLSRMYESPPMFSTNGPLNNIYGAGTTANTSPLLMTGGQGLSLPLLQQIQLNAGPLLQQNGSIRGATTIANNSERQTIGDLLRNQLEYQELQGRVVQHRINGCVGRAITETQVASRTRIQEETQSCGSPVISGNIRAEKQRSDDGLATRDNTLSLRQGLEYVEESVRETCRARNDMHEYLHKKITDMESGEHRIALEFQKNIGGLSREEKEAYMEAIEVAPDVVHAESSYSLFLRFTENETKLAARIVAKHWTARKEIYGDRAFRSLFDLSGEGVLTSEEVSFLGKKLLVQLPDDTHGNSVFVFDSDKLMMEAVNTFPPRQRLRCFFYLHAKSALSRVERQKQGLIIVRLLKDASLNGFKHSMLSQFYRIVQDSLPIKLLRIHLCCIHSPNTKNHCINVVIPNQVQQCGKEIAPLIRIHLSSEGSKILTELLKFGLKRDGLCTALGLAVSNKESSSEHAEENGASGDLQLLAITALAYHQEMMQQETVEGGTAKSFDQKEVADSYSESDDDEGSERSTAESSKEDEATDSESEKSGRCTTKSCEEKETTESQGRSRSNPNKRGRNSKHNFATIARTSRGHKKVARTHF